MEWHSNNSIPLSHESSYNFLSNYNLEPFPGMGVKHPELMMEIPGDSGGDDGSVVVEKKKKKKMTSEQVELLEKVFKEEKRPGSDQKMKLARELGLQPRQVAVWFQNRRARQKVKQLERSYDSLKLKFDVVSKEKENLQDEVMKLRAMLGHGPRNNTKQVSNEVPGGEKTAVSMSAATTTTTTMERIPGGPGESTAVQQPPQQNGIAECHDNLFSGIDDFEALLSLPIAPYWAATLLP